MNDWKYWEVRLEVEWSAGADLLSATITFRIHAKSHGHAISLASCSIKQWGVNITDAKAVEVDI